MRATISRKRGVVRSMPLLIDLGNTQRPTLGLLAVSKYLRRPTFIDERPDQNTIAVAGPFLSV